MSDVSEVAVEDELAEIVEPLVKRVATITQEIETAESMLRLLRQKRHRLLGVIRSIDPDKAPSLYASRKQKLRKGRATNIGMSTLQAFTEWLQERREELNSNGGFRTVDVFGRADFDLLSAEGSVAAAMRRLHEEGIIQLDHVVKGRNTPDRQTGKFYKVV